MVNFFGNIIIHLKDLCGSFTLAIIFYAVMSALILSPLIRTNTINVLTCKALSKKIANVSSKYSNNDKQRYSELFSISSKYGIAIVSYPLCTIIEILLGFLMTLGFRNPSIIAQAPTLSGFSLTQTVIQVFKNNGLVFPLVVLIILAGIVEIAYSADVQDDFIVDLAPVNFVSRIITFIIALVLPTAFLIYWIAFEVIEVLVMEYITRWRVEHFIDRLKSQLKRKGKTL